jgi:hypothetical protein
MSKVPLTGIIAGIIAVILALILSVGIVWYRRKRRQALGTEIQTRTDQAGDAAGDSQGTRLSKLGKDGDASSVGEKDNRSTVSSLTSLSKLEKACNLDAEQAESAALRTPVLLSSEADKNPLTPSHPDYVPVRPPRPHQQNLFDASPVKSIQHNPPSMTQKHASKASEAGMSTYQRNLMALTSSMAFDSPPVLQNTFRPIPRPEDSPFADMHAINPVSRKPSLPRNMKKDTIVVRPNLTYKWSNATDCKRLTVQGFAESYGDLYAQSDPVPVQPLYIRSTQNDTSRPLGLAINAVQDGRSKTSPHKSVQSDRNFSILLSQHNAQPG